MHPQAISQILDAEASKWIQSDEGSVQTSSLGEDDARQQQTVLSHQLSLEDRSKVRSEGNALDGRWRWS